MDAMLVSKVRQMTEDLLGNCQGQGSHQWAQACGQVSPGGHTQETLEACCAESNCIKAEHSQEAAASPVGRLLQDQKCSNAAPAHPACTYPGAQPQCTT